MTNNTIKHLGIVESIQGSHLSVRIVQTSACAACSAKGHCSSADSKDKIIDIMDTAAASYQVGERVMVVGETSMGMMAVVLAFIIPFVLLIFSLFLFIYDNKDSGKKMQLNCKLYCTFTSGNFLYT